jgi:predicted DNA-binding transcriptional regulator YafY
MNVFHDNSRKYRLLGVLKDLLEQPYHFTKMALATKYGVSPDAIKTDFEELRDADFLVKVDNKHKYYIAPNKSLEYLEEVLFFTEPEKEFLLDALTQANATDKRMEKIRMKLETVYDVSKLGSSLFSRTFLNKANLLEQAKKQKRVVQLVNYRSTMSSKVSDRLVEPFNVSTKDDILHAFDLDKKEIRHFRISRIEKIRVLDAYWQHETKHHSAATDSFRIVSDQQVFVHLKLRTGALNELIERFPLAQAYIQPCAEQDDLYDFACKVNDKFLGLTNFILGYYAHIEAIIEPESLIDHIRGKSGEIRF